MEAHVPKKMVSMNSVRRVPLYKVQLSLIKLKHKLWDKYCKTKSVPYHIEACKIRNKVKNIIKKAKKDYELSICNKVKTDPKLTWQYIKSKTKLRSGIPELYTDKEKKTLTKKKQRKSRNTLFVFQ